MQALIASAGFGRLMRWLFLQRADHEIYQSGLDMCSMYVILIVEFHLHIKQCLVVVLRCYSWVMTFDDYISGQCLFSPFTEQCRNTKYMNRYNVNAEPLLDLWYYMLSTYCLIASLIVVILLFLFGDGLMLTGNRSKHFIHLLWMFLHLSSLGSLTF